MLRKKRRLRFPWFLLGFLLLGLLSVGLYGSGVDTGDPVRRARVQTSGETFNFLSWELQAFYKKMETAALKAERFLDEKSQVELVRAYADQVNIVEAHSKELRDASSQPHLTDRDLAVASAKNQLDESRHKLERLAYLAEPILQNQTESTLRKLGFGTLGQVFPPVLYHVSELPLNLILSPRHIIRSEEQISLKATMDSLEQDTLEKRVESVSGLSALIEPIGGMGAYPSMVMQTSDLNWLTEVIAHEWVHNWLTLRPLGIRYFDSGALRTMNETSASLAGKEVGRALIRRYYPDLQLWPVPQLESYHLRNVERIRQPAPFKFRLEMRETRINTDALLAAGNIAAAEQYMEARRAIFWENGYHLRKLNQAYFAFYGAYDDEPGGGAAGHDPVGPAVRELRMQSPSLQSFLRRIARLTSYEDLQELLALEEEAGFGNIH